MRKNTRNANLAVAASERHTQLGMRHLDWTCRVVRQNKRLSLQYCNDTFGKVAACCGRTKFFHQSELAYNVIDKSSRETTNLLSLQSCALKPDVVVVWRGSFSLSKKHTAGITRANIRIWLQLRMFLFLIAQNTSLC